MRTAVVKSVCLAVVALSAVVWSTDLPGPDRVAYRLRCLRAAQFDPTVWADPQRTAGGVHVRACMVRDLLRSGRLRSADADGVAALLGRPERIFHTRTAGVAYWLGLEPGIAGIDSEWLVLTFDARGRVVDARIIAD